jgi:hypothetical protein
MLAGYGADHETVFDSPGVLRPDAPGKPTQEAVEEMPA